MSRSDWIAFSMSVRVIIAIGNWNCTDFPEIKKEPQSVEGRAVVWRRELNAWRKYAVFPSTFVKIAYYAINDGRDDLWILFVFLLPRNFDKLFSSHVSASICRLSERAL